MRYVIGHENPDTDSVCACLALSMILNAKPLQIGKMNEEALYILKKLGHNQFVNFHALPNDQGEYILVDHNNPEESIGEINKHMITHIYDHHANESNRELGDYIYSLPSTCHVIYYIMDLFGFKNRHMLKIYEILYYGMISDNMGEEDDVISKLARWLGKDTAIEYARLREYTRILGDIREYTISGIKIWTQVVFEKNYKKISAECDVAIWILIDTYNKTTTIDVSSITKKVLSNKYKYDFIVKRKDFICKIRKSLEG